MPKPAPQRRTQSRAKQSVQHSNGSTAARVANGSAPTMVVDGTSYPLAQEDLTTLDISALRRATGMGLVALSEAAVNAPDVDIVAAWVWLSRRSHGEPGLPFAVVAGEIGYDSDVSFGDAEEPASAEEPAPEASGGS